MAKAIIIRALGFFALWCALFGVSEWVESVYVASHGHEIAVINPVHPHSHHGANKIDGNFLATELEETQSFEKKTTKSISLEGFIISWVLKDFMPKQTHFKALAEFTCTNPSRPLFLWQAVFRI